MNTTDPTPLAEQIAREHHIAMVVEHEGTGPVRLGCSCGLVSTGAERLAHIATVTEQAVVERARDAIARMNITGPMRAIFTDPVHREALDALEVLVAQEIETALHAIANGDTDA